MIKELTIFGLILGVGLGAAVMLNAPAEGDAPYEGGLATITLGPAEYDGHYSSEIKGVFIVKDSDRSGNENDNLLDDPSGIVAGYALSDASFSTGISVDWGVTYVVVIAVWGDNTDTSLDKNYMRVGIDGDEWGNDDGTIDWATENIGSSNSYWYNAAYFDVGGENHIAVNFWDTTTFSLNRDETLTVDNVMYQVFK